MKTSKSFIALAVFTFLLVAAGCSSSGIFTAGNVTDVQLHKNNYRIAARGVSGTAQAGYIFGASMSTGMLTNTFALLRIEGTGMLYMEALDDLWKNYEAAHGPGEGKTLALINVHYDSDAMNWLVYTRPKIMVRADVIEFVE